MKIATVFVLVVLVAAGGYYLHLCKQKEEQFQALIEGEPMASMTVDQIISLNSQDSFSTEREYNEKLLDITGPVREMELDGEAPCIRLGHSASTVTCVFAPDTENLDTLTHGDIATIRGLVHISDYDISMDYCRVLE